MDPKESMIGAETADEVSDTGYRLARRRRLVESFASQGRRRVAALRG